MNPNLSRDGVSLPPITDGVCKQLCGSGVDSFPYTRYGHIEGGEKVGLVYLGRVALAKNSLLVDGTKVKLTPGMSLSVENKTDQRREIDHLLSPFQQETEEAMSER